MIQLQAVTKSYGETPVLKGISHTFYPGKIYVIKGVSGCGKSTLLNILGGLDTAYQGAYISNGVSVNSLDPDEISHYRRSIGYLFQNSLLLSHMTIWENLLFIENCPERIRRCARELGVEDLLTKFPDQLSGGERQRMAMIRALLHNPTLILADEPTASLDRANSRALAQMMNRLRSTGAVVIIATHESCFDDIADEILTLDYGAIASVVTRPSPPPLPEPEPPARDDGPHKAYSLLKYVYKRSREKLRPHKLLPPLLILLILLAGLSLQSNFQREFIRGMTARYPVTVFPLTHNQYGELDGRYAFETYQNFRVQAEDCVGLPLLEKAHSGLAYGGVIAFGRFPEAGNEVLINQPYANQLLHTTDYASCVGKTIVLGGASYTVSGVLSALETQEQQDLVYDNPYYRVETAANVFIPYETIRQRGTEAACNEILVRLDTVYEQNLYKQLRADLGNRPISIWDAKVMNLQSLIDSISLLVLALVLLVAFVALLFLYSEIQLELFYRRREIGYLQVFNIPRSRVQAGIILERLLRTAAAMAGALILFHLLALGLLLLFDVHAFLPLPALLAFAAAVLGYSALTAALPCRKFLKQDIIRLIT